MSNDWTSHWQLNVYADGEITARTLHNNFSIQGRQKEQKAQPYCVSKKGRNNIRRATNGYLATHQSAIPILLTLTTQHQMADWYFKRHLTNWLKRGKN